MSKPEINVTPLIDVLLVLLIIFMVVTPMKPSSLNTKIPQEPKSDQPTEVNPKTLVVTIAANSELELNKTPEGSIDDPERLVNRLSSIFQQRTQNLVYAESTGGSTTTEIEKTVFIKAPRKLDYGSVARVVDAVKRAGANPVSLQIDNLD